MSAQDRAALSVLLSVKDMAASVRFYRDQLGFEIRASWPNEREPTWCNMVLDEQSVMLCTGPVPEEGGESCHEASPEDQARFRKRVEELQAHKRGVGVTLYLRVPDIDHYREELRDRGVKVVSEPTTQIYGIRELTIDDPDGYELSFHTQVTLPSCESCGIPLTDAQPGQKYCPTCTNERGQLRPYEQVFEGTVTGFYMTMHKLPRKEAEEAARKHLRKMPAWAGF